MARRPSQKRNLVAQAKPALTIVGCGIQSATDLTRGACQHIRRAGKVLCVVAEPVTLLWLQRLNPNVESLHHLYAADKPRQQTYQEMVAQILRWLRAGSTVCVVSYGHPGVFADAMHAAIGRARNAGFAARMLPGISAIDWLYADLGIDPATRGCQIHDASEFLAYQPRFDPTAGLMLLQVGAIGEPNQPRQSNARGFRMLRDYLANAYGPHHEVVLYEASPYAIANPSIQRAPLGKVQRLRLSLASTLYVPPKKRRAMHKAFVAKLAGA
jgi:precorrin-6B methylase 1